MAFRFRTIIPATCALMLAFACFSPAPAYAADEDIPYGIRMPYRIFRGITNIALGWTEILLRPIGEFKNENPIDAFAKGFYDTLQRGAAGCQDIFMFWVPDMQMENSYPDWQVWPYLFHWS